MPQNAHYDSLFIEVECNKKSPIIVGIVYKPPDSLASHFQKHLSSSIDLISKTKQPAFICGDFNFDLLKYSSHGATNDFLTSFYRGSFYPLIDKPTRVTTKSSTLIDNIFTNILDTQISPGILYADLSDHFPVFQLSINSSNTNDNQNNTNNNIENKYITKRTINKVTKAKLGLALGNTNWDEVIDSNSADSSYNIFVNQFSCIYNNSLPNTKVKVNKRKQNKPWITDGIITSIKTRNRLYKKYKDKPTDANKANYITHRNKITHLIRISRGQYYNNKFNNYKSNIKKPGQLSMMF